MADPIYDNVIVTRFINMIMKRGKRSVAERHFYAAMKKHYPWTERLIASFIAHTHADQKLGHEDAFLLMCQSVPPLTRREVRPLNEPRQPAPCHRP